MLKSAFLIVFTLFIHASSEELLKTLIESSLLSFKSCMSKKHPCDSSTLDCSNSISHSSILMLNSLSQLISMISFESKPGSHMIFPGVRTGVLRVTSSSFFGEYQLPDTTFFDYALGNSRCGWIPSSADTNVFIQYGSPVPYIFEKIITTGLNCNSAFVKTFKIKYSLDGINWLWYQNGFIFTANTDDSTKVENIFEPFLARSIRVYPVTTQGMYGFKAEVFLSNHTRKKVLNDGQLLAATPCGFNVIVSSIWSNGEHDYKLILGGVYNTGQPSGWATGFLDANQWVIFNSFVPMMWMKIATKGRAEAAQFIKSYYIMYTEDGANWIYYQNKVVLNANIDEFTVVENVLVPFVAIGIRIHPVTWFNHIFAQIEVYCSEV